MNRILFEEVQETLAGVLQKFGFSAERALNCARLFAETTCDGVYTHGINRFPRFIATIRNGCVDVSAEPLRVAHVVEAVAALDAHLDGAGHGT